MFRTKLISFTATTTPKPFKIDNVLVNVVIVITIRNQQSKQQVFKEREPIKTKGAKEWQQKERLQYSFIEIVKRLQQSGAKKQLATINEGSLQSNWVGVLDNLTMSQPIVSNQIGVVNKQLVISEQIITEKTLEIF